MVGKHQIALLAAVGKFNPLFCLLYFGKPCRGFNLHPYARLFKWIERPAAGSGNTH